MDEKYETLSIASSNKSTRSVVSNKSRSDLAVAAERVRRLKKERLLVNRLMDLTEQQAEAEFELALHRRDTELALSEVQEQIM